MNGYTEAWCLSFNQHLGKSLLVPVDVSKRCLWKISKVHSILITRLSFIKAAKRPEVNDIFIIKYNLIRVCILEGCCVMRVECRKIWGFFMLKPLLLEEKQKCRDYCNKSRIVLDCGLHQVFLMLDRIICEVVHWCHDVRRGLQHTVNQCNLCF